MSAYDLLAHGVYPQEERLGVAARHFELALHVAFVVHVQAGFDKTFAEGAGDRRVHALFVEMVEGRA